MGIHEDALNGSLTQRSLNIYLAGDTSRSLINSRGGDRSLTPLAAATLGGHRNIVKLLLLNRADPNTLSRHDRSPLYYATTMPNRTTIVSDLLDSGANINYSSPEDDFNTPLMNAVFQLKDKALIRVLVNHRGVDLNAKNREGKTAVDLAKAAGIEEYLRNQNERISSRAEIVNAVVSVVMHVIAYVNSGLVGEVISGIEDKYGIKGTVDRELEEDIPIRPITVAELTENLDTYMKESGLQEFFEPDDPFLKDIVRNAAKLRNDPSSSFGSREDSKRLARQSMYQTVIYCDDSSSMSQENRFAIQHELVIRIASIATMLVPDQPPYNQVELSYINNKSATLMKNNIKPPRIVPNGGTPIGTHLRSKILEPLVYRVLSSGGRLQRPLLVCVITDGCPTKEQISTLQDVIRECGEELVAHRYDATSVMFCISQIGNDARAEEYIVKLRADTTLRDVLYCTADRLDEKYKQFRDDERKLDQWLLKLLGKPISGEDD